MATKLKNLKVKKVDFVDEGANPDAHIELFKRKDGKPEEDPKQHRSKRLSGNSFSIRFPTRSYRMDGQRQRQKTS